MVWFKKKEHIIDRSARNASAVIPGSKGFDEDKFTFLDGKIEELLKCSAIEELPEGVLPDVLTRLSLAPKPGGARIHGELSWICDLKMIGIIPRWFEWNTWHIFLQCLHRSFYFSA